MAVLLKKRNAKIYVRKIEINGFKFLYELLSLSKGNLAVNEVPLILRREVCNSKLDIAIVWDFPISIIHNLTLRLCQEELLVLDWLVSQVYLFNFYYFIFSRNISN